MAFSSFRYQTLKYFILVLSFALLLTLTTAKSPPEKIRIQVMTYNIKQMPVYASKEDQQQRLKELVKALKSLYRSSSPYTSSSSSSSSSFSTASPRPDVIVFQEMMTPESFKEVREGLRPYLPYHTQVLGEKCPSKANCPSRKNCQVDGWTTLTGDCHNGVLSFPGGVAIFSRFPIEEAHGLFFEVFGKGSFDHFANKGAVMAKIMVPESHRSKKKEEHDHECRCDSSDFTGQHYSPHWPIWIVGTHLQAAAANGAVRFPKIREKQMLKMKKWVDDHVMKRSELVIVAGDLNVPLKGRTRKSKSKCLEAKAIADQKTTAKIRGHFTPKCEADGSYSMKQCHGSTGFCWCATHDGKEVAGTRKIGKLDCSIHRISDLEKLLRAGSLAISVSPKDLTIGSYSTVTNLLTKSFYARGKFDNFNLKGLYHHLKNKGWPVDLKCKDPRSPIDSFTAVANILTKTHPSQLQAAGKSLGCSNSWTKLFTQSHHLIITNLVLDYVGYREDYLHPIDAPAQMVWQLKAEKEWFWEVMKNKLPKTKGFYRDLSDHYPVVADLILTSS